MLTLNYAVIQNNVVMFAYFAVCTNTTHLKHIHAIIEQVYLSHERLVYHLIVSGL